MAIDLGDLVPLTVNTRDADGVLSNATAVTLTVMLPDGTTTVVTPANPSTGLYQYDFVTTQTGRHTYRFVATGVNASAYTGEFDVDDAYSSGIVSLEDTKTQLKILGTDSDEELRGYIQAATEVIRLHTHKTVVRTSVVDDYTVRSSQTLALKQSPVISLTSVVTTDGLYSWNVPDLYVSKASGLVKVIRGPWFAGDLEATYTAGAAVIQANYILAASIIVQHLWLTKRPTKGGPRPGGMDDSLAMTGLGFAVPNRALQLLGKPPPLVA